MSDRLGAPINTFIHRIKPLLLLRTAGRHRSIDQTGCCCIRPPLVLSYHDPVQASTPSPVQPWEPACRAEATEK
jgi:hypothetical protein